METVKRVRADEKWWCNRLIPLIDNTSLKFNESEQDIETLVNLSVQIPSVAAICVYPSFVSLVKQRLPKPSNVKIATVANFPLGKKPLDSVEEEVAKTLSLGVDEIDLVVDYNAIILDAPRGLVDAENLVRAVKKLCDPQHVLVKAIIESGELETSYLIKAASIAVLKGGADFVKTSTGKTSISATPQACEAILQGIEEYKRLDSTDTACRNVGIKLSGGIKDVKQTISYVKIIESAFGEKFITPKNVRFGTSSLLTSLRYIG